MINFLKYLKAHMQHRAAVRATINELRNLTNAELNDIGISRGEIYHIAHTHNPKPVFEEAQPVESNENIKGWV